MTATTAVGTDSGATATGASSGGRRVLPYVLVGLLLLVGAALAGRPPSSRPFDPGSTRPDGARGLVLLLEALGADVVVVRGAPPDDASAALVLRDRLDDDDTAAAIRWADEGGVLVVADPASDLAADVAGTAGCPAALDDVERLRLPSGDDVARAPSCFDGAVRVDDRGEGAGAIVVVDTLEPPLFVEEPSALFVNDLLDEEDNAVLAAVLLAPTPGARVAILEGSPGGDGDTTLVDLLSPSVRQALLQLLVVAALFVLWRGRRLGRPVVETQPVAVAGSELVLAVGRLLDARRRPDEAAATLRADTRRALERRLGVAADGPVGAAAEAVAARTGLPPAEVAAALETTPVATDADLVAVAGALDRIRQLALGPAPGPRRNP